MPRVGSHGRGTFTRRSRTEYRAIRAVSQDIKYGRYAKTPRESQNLNGGPPNRMKTVMIDRLALGEWAREREPIPGIDGAVGWGMGA